MHRAYVHLNTSYFTAYMIQVTATSTYCNPLFAQVAIALAGGVPPLIELLKNGSEEAKEQAAGALHVMSVSHDNKVRTFKITDRFGIRQARESHINLCCLRIPKS